METSKKYFLAANSGIGFVSYFDTAYDPKDNWRAYIIKGGAGTGKSTFMKKIANEYRNKGYMPELVPCSSDPDSLDGVIIPEIKIAIFDGTAPHTLDPKYAGAVETILNFGEFWDAQKLTKNAYEIMEITDKNKALHKTAAVYLLAAGNLIKDNISTQQKALNSEKIKAYTKNLCKKYIKQGTKYGKEKVRFLTGISPKGIISFPETILKYTDKPIIIRDNFGGISNEILSEIRSYALTNGFEIITFKNPFLPQYIDHIVIPKLNLAFVTENNYIKFDCETRRVHFERFVFSEKLRIKRLKYNKKTANELLNSAIEALKIAKITHDDLEKIYINAMDYKKLDEFTNSFIKKQLG